MANKMTTVDALTSLKPKAEWALRGDELEWLDSVQTEPTTAELAAEVTRLQSVYNGNAYQRTRATVYPSVADQLDSLYHNGIDGWKETIKVVKDAHPKP